MISKDFLELLRCPHHRVPLQQADETLVSRLNSEIAGGQLTNRAGEQITAPLDEALVDEGHRLAYPVRDAIPCLLADQAIELSQLAAEQVPESR